MFYLVDTNVFLHAICSEIYDVADMCQKNNHEIVITQTILDELEPGYYREREDASSKEVYNAVYNSVAGTWGKKTIRIVDLKDVPGAKEELKKIRDRFYSWMHDSEYLQKLIQEKKITREEIKKKSFKNKDLGECELVAIAKASSGEYFVVTNDKGRVFLHPDQNIFEYYEEDADVVILTSEEWMEEIGFGLENDVIHMVDSRCGLHCTGCEYKETCGCEGCIETNGYPFHGKCPVAACCQKKSIVHCGECPDIPCELLSGYSSDPEHGDHPVGARIEQCKRWYAEVKRQEAVE